MTASLAVTPFLAAIVLLASVAVGHAKVSRLATDLHVLDASTKLPTAAPAVVLRHAGRKNPVSTASAIPASASASHTRRPEPAVVLLH